MQIVLFAFGLYLTISILMSVPVILWLKSKAGWVWWEILIYFHPFFVWVSLASTGFNLNVKSLSNWIVEPFLLALVVPVALLARGLIGERPLKKMGSICILLITLAMVTIVFRYFPGIDE